MWFSSSQSLLINLPLLKLPRVQLNFARQLPTLLSAKYCHRLILLILEHCFAMLLLTPQGAQAAAIVLPDPHHHCHFLRQPRQWHPVRPTLEVHCLSCQP